MKLEQLKSEIMEEWKCTCVDCGHINDIYGMDDLMELITTAYNAGLERAVEVVEGMDTLTSEQNLHLGELIVKDELLTQLQAEVNKDNK